MVLRSAFFQLLIACSAIAEPAAERMDPVVPESIIPPSPFLTPDEALKSFRLAPGFIIEPVATEPMIEKPVCLDFDAAGRMWVCEMRGYMPDIAGKGESVPHGRIVILEDSDGDGKADKRSVFLDEMLLPRAVSVFEDGVLYMDEKRLCWIARKGDQPSGDPVEIPFDLVATGNVEHKPNGLLAGLDNRYYLAKADQRLRRTATGWELEPTAFRGQWGIARDDFGTLYHNNNSTLLFADLLAPNLLQGNPGVRMKTPEFTQLGSNRVWPVRVTPAVNRAYTSKAHGFDFDVLDPETFKLINSTAASGMTIYRGMNFPKEWQGVAIVTEPVCNLVKVIRIAEKDGKPIGSHPFDKSEFLASTDERFRPVNAYNAPDGSLYLLDMYHGIIQHETYMTPYLRQQILSRGLESPALEGGRIWRIRAEEKPVEKVTDLSMYDAAALVKSLASPNVWEREIAQRLLVGRKDKAAVTPLVELAKHGERIARIHAIWTLEGMGELKADFLTSALLGTDAKVQSSALWATTRLSPTELATLETDLTEVKPATAEVVPYLVRALGPLGTPAALARVAQLLRSHREIALVREAAVSGLDQHEKEFQESHLAGVDDPDLVKWLTQGRREFVNGQAVNTALTGDDLASFTRGKQLFHGMAACFGCHGADGAGVPNLGPPLADSEWVTGDAETLVKILLHGLTGPIEVDGIIYHTTADMPGLATNPTISDTAIADVATYIRNEWSNHAQPVSPTQVARERELGKDRGGRPMTAAELRR
ncbi:MAG: c-type cytochrome [Verrucomicrobiota bacterium]